MATFGNTTDAASPSPLSALLDTFIPGFSIFSSLVSTYLHIDISSYLLTILLLLGLLFALNHARETLFYTVSDYFISTAEIRKDDEMYNYLMFWVSLQPFSQHTPQFVAGTKTTSDQVWDRDYDSDDEDARLQDDTDAAEEQRVLSSGGYEDYLRLSHRDKLKPLQYTPSEGRHFFRYQGRWLVFTRVQEEKQPMWASASERIYISCLGRNTSVLKALLCEAQLAFLERDGNRTVIYRGQRKGGEGGEDWVRCMSRPPRPLSTVVLDAKQKQEFIRDVGEYLHPQTRRWYSNRGIPYRRGYLFHGPPGTGKTSLCFALAGLFGLRIYVVSLNSKTLTEDGLANLFQSLPRRCIVLLEDIDTAGVTSERSATAASAVAEAEAEAEAEKEKAKEKAKAEDKAAPGSAADTPAIMKGISLSALLNIIDGVASSEGRILVMTTNHIEKLDAALLRPGRVDMGIGFGNADRETIGGLFRAVYLRLEGDWPAEKKDGGSTGLAASTSPTPADVRVGAEKPRRASTASGIFTTTTPAQEDEKTKPQLADSPFGFGFLQNPIHHHGIPDEEIRELANKFADAVPSGEFTPAEVQGYLLKHKSEPREAVEGVEGWIVGLRKEREERERGKREKKEKEREKEREKEKEKEKERENEKEKEKEKERENEKEKEKEKEREKEKVGEGKDREGEKAKVAVVTPPTPPKSENGEDEASGVARKVEVEGAK